MLNWLDGIFLQSLKKCKCVIVRINLAAAHLLLGAVALNFYTGPRLIGITFHQPILSNTVCQTLQAVCFA